MSNPMPFLDIPLICPVCGEMLRRELASRTYYHESQEYNPAWVPCVNFGKRYKVTAELRVVETTGHESET